MSEKSSKGSDEVPVGSPSAFFKYMKYDFVSGLFVFLIALPLCLGISLSSGYPAIAGIFTAIVGAVVTTFISNSELTIKGPAAGLIAIAAGCIGEFGGPGNPAAYKAALAVGVAAAVLQILFGLFRAGILGEFFPSAAVHGMLAAIGIIIIVKQIPVVLGVIALPPETPAVAMAASDVVQASEGTESADNPVAVPARKSSKGPFQMMADIPRYVANANPKIALIGIVSLLIMFIWPAMKSKLGPLKLIPAPMIVLLASVPMGMAFDLLNSSTYEMAGRTHELGEQYLVDMPDRVFGMFDEITYPDFSALKEIRAWKWVMMFFIIGSLESLLSAKAVDLLDPWKRKTNMDRDIIAVGVANLGAACIGGLPMISEIVRSKANIDNGARTRFADLWHGVFLLLCVALIPTVLHRIPLSALAAMLVYTGSRLAHPTEFIHVYRIGKEQLAIFVVTLIVVLAEDLLVGVAAGIALKMIIHIINGVPLKSMFKPFLEVQVIDDQTSIIIARESAVFSNWIPFKRQIEDIGLVQRKNLIIDVSNTQLVDHSVMEKLEAMERDFEMEGLEFEVRGLDALQPIANSAYAARKRGLASMRRLTVVANADIERWLEENFVRLGATGFTSVPCKGAGRSEIKDGLLDSGDKVRIEVVTTHATCEAIIGFLRKEVLPKHHVTPSVENVDVIRRDQFEDANSSNPPADH